jgi:hypothetical protein
VVSDSPSGTRYVNVVSSGTGTATSQNSDIQGEEVES